MAAAIQAQPPKPPPPPKVEAKAEPKPAEAPKAVAQASPAQAKTPDLFDQASGGGRVLASSGGSSFTPAVTAANAAVKDAVTNAKSSLQGAVNNAASGVVSAASTAGANTLTQVTPFGPAKPPDLQTLNQISASQGGFATSAPTDFSSDPYGLGDIGKIFGGGGISQPVSQTDRFFGGAPGGVSEGRFFSVSDSVNNNFTRPGQGPSFLNNDGGGGKPGLGGGGSLDFLNQLGGGAVVPVSSASQPSVSLPSVSLPSPSGSSSSRGHQHLNLFSLLNFGNRGSGGGGAPGGVAEGRER